MIFFHGGEIVVGLVGDSLRARRLCKRIINREIIPAGKVSWLGNPVDNLPNNEDRLWHEIFVFSSPIKVTPRSDIQWDFVVESEDDAVLLMMAW